MRFAMLGRKSAIPDVTILLIVDLIYLVIVTITLITIFSSIYSQSVDPVKIFVNTYPMYIMSRCFGSSENFMSNPLVLNSTMITQKNFDNCFYFNSNFAIGLNLTFYRADNLKSPIATIYKDKNDYLLWKALSDGSSGTEYRRIFPVVIEDNGKQINAIAKFDFTFPRS